MKKILSLSLVFVMLISLTACGGSNTYKFKTAEVIYDPITYIYNEDGSVGGKTETTITLDEEIMSQFKGATLSIDNENSTITLKVGAQESTMDFKVVEKDDNGNYYANMYDDYGLLIKGQAYGFNKSTGRHVLFSESGDLVLAVVFEK